jgi:hypothetical protein
MKNNILQLHSKICKMLFASLLCFTSSLHAADSYNVAPGTTDITEHTVCSRITNATGKNLFVPTKTAGEWAAFRSTASAGITNSSCGTGNVNATPWSGAAFSENNFCGVYTAHETITTHNGNAGTIYVEYVNNGSCEMLEAYIDGSGIPIMLNSGDTININHNGTLMLRTVENAMDYGCEMEITLKNLNAGGTIIGTLWLYNYAFGICM